MHLDTYLSAVLDRFDIVVQETRQTVRNQIDSSKEQGGRDGQNRRNSDHDGTNHRFSALVRFTKDLFNFDVVVVVAKLLRYVSISVSTMAIVCFVLSTEIIFVMYVCARECFDGTNKRCR